MKECRRQAGGCNGGAQMADVLRISIIQTQAYDMLSPHHADNEMFYMLEMERDFKPDIVLLPECVWPGYFLHGWDYSMQEKADDVKARLASTARKMDCFIVAGLPEPDKSGPTAQMLPFMEGWMQPAASPIYNAALAWNKAGRLVASGRKINLWHFDGKWFKKGEGPVVFRTKWGNIGLMVCADARMPGIVEKLAEDGARLVLNCTNWVTSGPDRSKLTNPQADYLIRVRAVENNLWIASANKVGLEDGLIAFCGGSQLVAPDGTLVKRASADKVEAIRAEIPLDEQGRIELPEPKIVRLSNPAFYESASGLTDEGGNGTPEPDGGRIQGFPQKPSHPYVAVVQQSPESAGQPGTGLVARAAMKRLAAKIDALGADIVVFSGTFEAMTGLDPQARALLDEPTMRGKMLVIPRGRCEKCGNPIGGADVVFDGKSLQQYGALTVREGTRGCPNCGFGDSVATAPVVQTPFGPLGLVLGREGHEHRMVASLSGMGVRMFAWITSGLVPEHDIITRARAMESRVWMITANPAMMIARQPGLRALSGLSLIAEPDGRVACSAFPDEEQIVAAYCDLCLCERRDVVPGTLAMGR